MLPRDRQPAERPRAKGRRACDACGSLEREAAFLKEGCEILRCRECRFLFVDPCEADAAAAYGEAYFLDAAGGYQDYLAARELKLWSASVRLRLLERFASPGRLLEVGCAAGFFLEAARARGWVVEGIEVSPAAAAWAIGRGFSVRAVEIEDAPFESGSFDAIVILDVLEHLRRPARALEKCRNVLKSSGAILIEVPNLNGIVSRIMGRRSPYFRPRVHLSYFSPKTLSATLSRAGFDVRYLRPSTKPFSVDYLAGVLRSSNPMAARILRALGEGLGSWSHAAVRLPLGSLLCVASPSRTGKNTAE